MKEDIPLVSIGFDGYGIEATLKGLSKTNSKRIILCCIDGFTKHVVPEDTTVNEWQETKRLVEKADLTFYGLFGHCALSDPNDLRKLKKRMEYTRFMGGDYIDTNAGPQGQENGFFENLPEIIELADELDLTVCLETHGDILISGEVAKKIFKKVNSPRIKVSYDPSNIYFYTRGETDPVRDVEHIFDHIGMIHYKGVQANDDKTKWGFPTIEEAVFDYNRFFDYIQKRKYAGMIAVELEGRFRFEEEQGFIVDPVWPEEKIVNLYNNEIDYLQKKLYWM